MGSVLVVQGKKLSANCCCGHPVFITSVWPSVVVELLLVCKVQQMQETEYQLSVIYIFFVLVS